MINHIVKIIKTADKLKAIGEEMKHSHLSALLLCSLPQSYDIFIRALEARPEDELSSDFIKGKLNDEFQMRRENSNSSNAAENRALKTNGKKPYKTSDNLKYCMYFHKSNHVKLNCWFLKTKQILKTKQTVQSSGKIQNYVLKLMNRIRKET